MNPTFFSLLLTVTAVFCQAEDRNSAFGGNTRDYNFLGSVRGKGYYVDFSQSLPWDQYRHVCRRANMTSASVESSQELDFLRNVLNGKGSFWTGGRDSFMSRQFTWDHLNSSLDTEVTIDVLHQPNPYYLNCLSLLDELGPLNIWIVPCSNSCIVLCEK